MVSPGHNVVTNTNMQAELPQHAHTDPHLPHRRPSQGQQMTFTRSIHIGRSRTLEASQVIYDFSSMNTKFKYGSCYVINSRCQILFLYTVNQVFKIGFILLSVEIHQYS